jgi:PKD repeat protein
MKKFLYIIFLFCTFNGIYAQIPTNCFEIESILVDACGTPEGENEMVIFQVGANSLNTGDLTVTWPNNSWLGVCQDASTAANVAYLNGTVLNCGGLIEPVGGVLPAGARVLLITSTNFSVGANSFAGLSDTIYVIFQCAGNTAGHFANATGSGTRTLVMEFSNPVGCIDSVTYDCGLLIDINGFTGTGGTAADRDGSTVEFGWDGSATYTNDGCNAPYNPLYVHAGPDLSGFCLGDTVNLTGSTYNSVTSQNWSGGTGSFINQTSDTNAFYVVGAGDFGQVMLLFSGTNCNGTVVDTMYITIDNVPAPVNIVPGGPVSLCAGDSITLTAIGVGPFSWSTTETTASIVVNAVGNYIVTQTTGCGTSYDTVVVDNNGSPPIAVITPLGSTALCPGDNLTLLGSGGTSFLWSTTETTDSIEVNAVGNYTLIVSNGCGIDTTSLTLTASPLPQAVVSPSSPITLCGGSVEVTATGTGNFTWSTGGTGSTETYNSAGNFYVVAANNCGTDTAFFTILPGSIVAGFNAVPTNGISPLTVNFTNTSVGATSYNWFFGDGNTSTQTDPTNIYLYPGIYVCTLIATDNGGCTDSATTIITVDSCLYLITKPNVITADGNGVNDQFYVTATCVDEFHVDIFDRWGLKVFAYDDITQVWAGNTFTNTQVTSGVYNYVIYLKDYNGDVHEYPGFIHVFE